MYQALNDKTKNYMWYGAEKFYRPLSRQTPHQIVRKVNINLAVIKSHKL